MPIVSCEKDGKPGYKYGEGNKSCFTYEKDNEESRKAAKKKAILQGVAIEGGEKLEMSKEDLEDLQKEFKIGKPVEMQEILIKSDENNCIFGWAYARERIDGTQVIDHSGEFVKSENFGDLELATYAYNLAYRQADNQHDCIAKGYLVESMVFSKEKMAKMKIPEGIVPESVWMGFYFPDNDDYEAIKKMKHPMFSFYGSVTKEIVDDIELVKEKGLGRMGGPVAGGPDGSCVCPKCGAKVSHETGKPCYSIKCPKCGANMTRKEVE